MVFPNSSISGTESVRWWCRDPAVALMIVLIEQYIHPASINSIRPLRDLDFGRILERLLKLSIPVLYFWCVRYPEHQYFLKFINWGASLVDAVLNFSC